MKICIISPFPVDPEKIVGGVEAVTSSLVPGLEKIPDLSEIHVFSLGQYKKDTCVRYSDKISVWYLKGQKSFNLPTKAYFDVIKVRNIIKNISPNIVHGEGIGFMGEIATTIYNNSIVTAHGLIHTEAKKKLKSSFNNNIRIRLTEKMVYRVLSKAKAVISTSIYDGQALSNMINGLHVTINNPVAPLFFKNDWIVSSNAYFLFSGLMHPRKNIAGIIRAFAAINKEYPDISLYITGPTYDQSYAQEIYTLIKNLKIDDSVKFLGLVDNNTLSNLIHQSIGVLLFSWEETSPTIIAQAMAAYKPVISSNIGGVSEMVVNNKSGFLVNPGDENHLIQRMRELLNSQNTRREMGALSNQIAREKFDYEKVAQKTYAVYKQILEENSL